MDQVKPYLRLPSSAPYAWAVYLALLLLFNWLGGIFMVLAIVPWIAFIAQVITNIIRLFKRSTATHQK